jgi:hypothetical protein
LGAVRGLHLDLLATGDRKRTEAAFREMLRLFSLAVQSRPKLSGPKHSKDWSARPASSSPGGVIRNTR